MSGKDDLVAHLQSGATTTCRAWRIVRKDGRTFGFTDHDCDIGFDGTQFLAGSGLTPGMLQQSSGLAVDNTEVIGALSDVAITETDLRAGRFDGAEVTTWLVNWNDPDQRMVRFRGHFGEIQIANGTFRVELRGLTEALNKAKLRTYQSGCSAVLGDSECRVDTTLPAYSVTTAVKSVGGIDEYFLPSQASYPEGWFAWGKAEVLSGEAIGLTAAIRVDGEVGGLRRIELMADFGLRPVPGDEIRLVAGCDRMSTTCRVKYNNFLNFRGFPHVPGSDWLASYPVSTQRNDGGSRLK